MTIMSVVQATEYAVATVTSVAALGFALFGSAGALERWLDRPMPSDEFEKRSFVKVRSDNKKEDACLVR